MQFLFDDFSRVKAVAALDESRAKSVSPVACFGLSHIHKMLLCGHLARQGKLLYICADEAEGQRALEDLQALQIPAELFVQRDISFFAQETSRAYEQKRIGTLSKLLEGDFSVAITTLQAAAAFTVPPDVLKSRFLQLKVGKTVDIASLVRAAAAAGYSRVDAVEAPGQFALRGGIFDIFPPDAALPYRIELWGDEIDSMHTFAVDSQRRIDKCNTFFITPSIEICPDNAADFLQALKTKAAGKHPEGYAERLREDIARLENGYRISYERYYDLVYPSGATLLDYTQNCAVIFSDTARIEERFKKWEGLLAEELVSAKEKGLVEAKAALPMLGYTEMMRRLTEGFTVYSEAFPKSNFFTAPAAVYHFAFKQISPWNGQPDWLREELTPGGKAVVLGGEERAARILAEQLSEAGLPAVFSKNPDSLPRGITITTGLLSQGYHCDETGLTVIPFGRNVKARKKSRYKKGGDIGAIEELEIGDLVVHAAHGIGLFDGVTQMKTVNGIKDYIRVKYRDSGVLYVPVTALDMISRYIGTADDKTVKLNKLGSAEWTKAKTRTRSAVKDIAKQLTRLYAKRMAQKGFAFAPDCDMQRDFENRFLYEETDDQLRAIAEIKDDMEQDVPMDRLLCGDVGFGKTEVALRAAFKCIADGKQCAVLVPTTILAWQHYNTATERFSAFPVNVEMLSRFRTASQQTKIKKDLKAGNIDLLVGTHRMIGQDVVFKDLGLLIVDEEQRFGVAQKEKLKERFPNVDVLTLSATPIPRTLNMALSGLRDMSSIEEAPGDRYPVQTYVLEQENGVLYAAMEKELRRGGQVYYIHNRVESIYATAARIATQFPEYAVGVAHGKMGEGELSEVWKALVEHEIDILVCTTIIETGVDVPNANTLIIENADYFGLSQLHQLRGRVGRSHRRAYAYFCFQPFKAVNETAVKRLDAIRRYTEFGAGFQIAMRDLEIRGAGNLLGGEQHGNMDAVGYDMYMRLLNEALREEKGEVVEQKSECSVDIQLSAHLPESYIPVLSQRLAMYRRIAAIATPEDADDVRDELRDRFGPVPAMADQLIEVALYKNHAAALGITDIIARNGSILLYMPQLQSELSSALIGAMRGRVLVNAGAKPYIAVRRQTGASDLDTLGEIFTVI
ncbi:MAG: transcription-repair coupling factor [Clostridia bacterium]|nr:transcription-repair coupling factor [Clostridia bacterium]